MSDQSAADRRYDELMGLLKNGETIDSVELDEVVGARLAQAAMEQPEPKFDDSGYIVVCINRYGVACAFGPYGEAEAHVIASFAERLVPTWMVNMYDKVLERYGMDSTGSYVELPEKTVPTLRDQRTTDKSQEPES